VKNDDIVVSVIVPFRNEEDFIMSFDNIIASSQLSFKCEFIFVDGMSSDNSKEQVLLLCEKYNNVHYLQNLNKTTPHALNIAIKASGGRYICRMDCHSLYSNDYVSRLYHSFQENDKKYGKLGNVGGIVRTKPKDSSYFSKAICEVLSSVFGVGNSFFRTSNKTENHTQIRVDTLPFGFYLRDVLIDLGGFDEELIKNQDDNLNYRLIKQGYVVLCDPSIVIDYYPVNSLSGVIKMFYNYGFYKPLSSLKVGGIQTYRQLVPFLFTMYLISMLIIVPSVDWPVFFDSLLLVPLCLYLLLLFWFSVKGNSTVVSIYKLLIFPVIHISYGGGYMAGIGKVVRKILWN